MRFLLRSLLVLAVALAFGIVLYYAVQALPGSSPNQPGAQPVAQNGGTVPQNRPPRPEGREDDPGGGFRLRSIVGVIGKVILFSVLVTISVLAKNFIFERNSKGK